MRYIAILALGALMGCSSGQYVRPEEPVAQRAQRVEPSEVSKDQSQFYRQDKPTEKESTPIEENEEFFSSSSGCIEAAARERECANFYSEKDRECENIFTSQELRSFKSMMKHVDVCDQYLNAEDEERCVSGVIAQYPNLDDKLKPYLKCQKRVNNGYERCLDFSLELCE